MWIVLTFWCYISFYTYISSAIQSRYREGADSRHNMLALPIPALAPYDSNGSVDPLGGLPEHSREFIRRMFSRAYANPDCNRKRPLDVVPIYYWPGETVRLKCWVCGKKQLYNGQMRYWAHLPRRVGYWLRDLKESWRLGMWRTVTEDMISSFFRRREYMPAFYSMKLAKNLVQPEIRMAQRDGHLIISQLRADNYGLYICFDRNEPITFHRVYLLIPHLMPFQHFRQKTTEDGRMLSRVMIDCYDSRTDTGENRWRKMDYSAQWRSYGSFMQNYDQGICAGRCDKNFLFDESRLNFSVRYGWKASDSAPDLLRASNLRVDTVWTAWSACGVDGLQTRSAECFLRKADARERFDPKRHVGGAELHRSLLHNVHGLLESVEAFRTQGIRFFSGVLSDSWMPPHWNWTNCFAPTYEVAQGFKRIREDLGTVIHVRAAQNRKVAFGAFGTCIRLVLDPTRLQSKDIRNRNEDIIGNWAFQNRQCRK